MPTGGRGGFNCYNGFNSETKVSTAANHVPLIMNSDEAPRRQVLGLYVEHVRARLPADILSS